MKIAVFGCSWSHGVKEIDNFYSWPYALHKLNPDWKIDNYAIGGSNLQFQTFLLNANKPDFEVTDLPQALKLAEQNGLITIAVDDLHRDD